MRPRTALLLVGLLLGLHALGSIIPNVDAQTLTILWSFTNGVDGAGPYAGLVQGSDGNFYGTTEGRSGTVFRISPSGTFTNLHTFTGIRWSPSCCRGSCRASMAISMALPGFPGLLNLPGTVFRISPGGSFTNLHIFSGSDGSGTVGGLVQGNDGNFYGTTYAGGTSNVGTVFRISPIGNFTTLYSFSGIDGAGPGSVLVQGNDGNFYGTGSCGGAFTNNAPGSTIFPGYGTVFRISPGDSFTNLYSFSGGDGSLPIGGLVVGSDGNFYGTTFMGDEWQQWHRVPGHSERQPYDALVIYGR